ncbi:hypothetical protein [Belnapia rosea]|uniref:hypothetical protein n=1 Tax=Belnapia rosea TaxID=938405 RepID=UPI001C4092E1|nr:hypothetical protein [Belnapia rosea]
MEATLCSDEEVIVVGNFAGQAAAFLSRTAAHVHVLVHGAGPGLALCHGQAGHLRGGRCPVRLGEARGLGRW